MKAVPFIALLVFGITPLVQAQQPASPRAYLLHADRVLDGRGGMVEPAALLWSTATRSNTPEEREGVRVLFLYRANGFVNPPATPN